MPQTGMHHHSLSFPVMSTEVKEEAVNLVVAMVAFAENLKQVCRRLSPSLALHFYFGQVPSFCHALSRTIRPSR